MEVIDRNNMRTPDDLKKGDRILLVDGVTVSFDGFKALNNLSFYINYGELRCIIGANGAGKSTMMDVVTGKTTPDKGSVIFGDNINLLGMDEPSIAQSGIGRKFQKPTVFGGHSVFENLELAMKDDKRFYKTLFSKLSGEQKSKIEQTMELVGLKELYNKEASILSHGQKQWLEIGMLIMQDPKLLLVDEPVAGMTPQEVEKTGEILTSLAQNHSVVVVEHDMEFIRSIAKKVTVLHEGSVLAEGSMNDIQNNEKVRKVYLGE
jgi:urea transport system ATP-binding protein